MSKIFNIVLTMMLLTCGAAFASSAGDYNFNQDRLMITNANVMVVSSFDSTDHITAYSDSGVRLWNIVFYPKILSWKLKDGYLFVFSKARSTDSTYVTCIDPVNGTIVWDRP